MTVAEFDDIEYEGIGADSHIDVRSERCFRDHSPSDTIISLDDDGQALYTCPVPSFQVISQHHPRLDLDPLKEQPGRQPESITKLESSSVTSILSHNGLITATQQRQLSPLSRYRQDEQGHERRALGMKEGEHRLDLNVDGPLPRPGEANGIAKCSKPSVISSLQLSPTSQQTPSSGPIPSASPESSSAAERLREVLEVIETPGWNEKVSPEEQADYLRRVYHAAETTSPVRDEPEGGEASQGSQEESAD
ncbi:hypothetical protein F5Y11DRAFT_185151 [Daldinia sp. FL1419]|nr:hypothetical protein F5Y11DRAFT_185151 [Daldinia sp. FL1419]